MDNRLTRWFLADVDRAISVVVIVSLGVVLFSGSADHILTLGARPDVHVTGWRVWTVAGSLEVIAAFSAWEVKRRHGWSRLIPILVLISSGAFVILANLAAARANSWAGRLPWDQMFAVAPPASFIAVFAIAETRDWKAPTRAKTRKAKTRETVDSKKTAPKVKTVKDPDTAQPPIVPPVVEPDPTPGRLIATAAKDGETDAEKRLRLGAARDACVDEVRAVLASGGRASQTDISAAYGSGATWAKGVRGEATRARALSAVSN